MVYKPNRQDVGGSWMRWGSPVPNAEHKYLGRGKEWEGCCLYHVSYISQSLFFFLFQFVVLSTISFPYSNTCWLFLSLQQFSLFFPSLHYLILCLSVLNPAKPILLHILPHLKLLLRLQAIILVGICFLYLAWLINLLFYKNKKPQLVVLLK